MSNGSLRRALTAAVVAAACITLSPHADAARNSGALERFVGRALDVADPTQATRPIDILIERWSTAEDVETLRETIPRGPETLLSALHKTWGRAAVLLSPGIMAAGARGLDRRAQNLQFAREVITANGRQVVFAADQHLWLGEKARRRLEDYELTLVDIPFRPDGKSVRKVAS